MIYIYNLSRHNLLKSRANFILSQQFIEGKILNLDHTLL